jgi:hypothetical protein
MPPSTVAVKTVTSSPTPTSPPTVPSLAAKNSAPIAVSTPEKVAEEFTVACPKCGQRGFYRVKDIKMLNAR